MLNGINAGFDYVWFFSRCHFRYAASTRPPGERRTAPRLDAVRQINCSEKKRAVRSACT